MHWQVGLSAPPPLLQKLTFIAYHHDPRIQYIDTVRCASFLLEPPIAPTARTPVCRRGGRRGVAVTALGAARDAASARQGHARERARRVPTGLPACPPLHARAHAPHCAAAPSPLAARMSRRSTSCCRRTCRCARRTTSVSELPCAPAAEPCCRVLLLSPAFAAEPCCRALLHAAASEVHDIGGAGGSSSSWQQQPLMPAHSFVARPVQPPPAACPPPACCPALVPARQARRCRSSWSCCPRLREPTCTWTTRPRTGRSTSRSHASLEAPPSKRRPAGRRASWISLLFVLPCSPFYPLCCMPLPWAPHPISPHRSALKEAFATRPATVSPAQHSSPPVYKPSAAPPCPAHPLCKL